MRATITKSLAIVALLLSTFAFAGAAGAANTNPNGAQVVKVHDCQDIGGGYQLCIDEQAVFQNVGMDTNPAGNSSTTINGRLCETVTDSTGAVVFQSCEKAHEHILIKDNTLQEEHLFDQHQVVTPFGTFCETINFHYANGQIQYENFSVNPGSC
jgi:hypothetical protein